MQSDGLDYRHPIHNPDGLLPRFQHPDEQVVIIMNGAGPPRDGSATKWIEGEDQWRKACASYRRGGRILLVREAKRSSEYRTWALEPFVADGRRGVALHPRFETDMTSPRIFRGQAALVSDPLMLSTTLRKLVDHISANEEFDRVSAPAAIGAGWGRTSGELALLHTAGLIVSTGSTKHYGPDHPDVRRLKTDKDMEHAPGNKTVYRKSLLWGSEFLPQWKAFIDKKDRPKCVPFIPGWDGSGDPP